MKDELRRYAAPIRKRRRKILAGTGVMAIIAFIAMMSVIRREGEPDGVAQRTALLLGSAGMGFMFSHTLWFVGSHLRRLTGAGDKRESESGPNGG